MKRLAKSITLPNGVKYASHAEMLRHGELLTRQKLGEIRNLRRQVSFPLIIKGRPIKIRSPRYKNGRECVYTCDFQYDEREPDLPHEPGAWREVIEESKGYYTDVARLRMAIFEAQYGIEIRRTGAQKMRRRKRAA